MDGAKLNHCWWLNLLDLLLRRGKFLLIVSKTKSRTFRMREAARDFDLCFITIFLNQKKIFLCLVMYNYKLSLCAFNH